MKMLITGSAGFIGYHVAKTFLKLGHEVVGVDNFTPYYNPKLKHARDDMLRQSPLFTSQELDICDKENLARIFAMHDFEVVLNLAAQPGVRYSLENPYIYQKTNVEGFLNVLECCRNARRMPRLFYASSSSVYGGNKKLPFSEEDQVDHPVSLYAATKKANELMAHTYSHLFKLQTIGFRFFTVYGPWYRPDMALWLFADAMVNGRAIKVFNNGDMYRDFTFVDDIVSGIVKCVESKSLPQCAVYNIGNHRSEKLLDVINILSKALGVNPHMQMLPMQPGDVYATYASIDKLRDAVGYEPTTSISDGIPVFAKWFRDYHQL